MSTRLPRRAGQALATSIVALALAGLPASFDPGTGSFGSGTAFADAGNGNGHGKGKGHGKGLGRENAPGQLAKAQAKDGIGKPSKADPMHPSNLGRLNGFFNASPNALKNTSPNSAIGILSQTYRDELADYAASEDETESTDDLAAILAKAANKPLTAEQVEAIHARLVAENPDALADFDSLSDEEKEQLAADLADEANEIQATETNQGLGTEYGEADDGDADDDSDDGAIADAAESVGEAMSDAADYVADRFDDVF